MTNTEIATRIHYIKQVCEDMAINLFNEIHHESKTLPEVQTIITLPEIKEKIDLKKILKTVFDVIEPKKNKEKKR